ncbi:MAG: ABC transporter substrate-binding protein [Lachnospiraceae bacterium]|nr:ABC transporter substrate-binding protein [Lachnospiraceae bacterium]
MKHMMVKKMTAMLLAGALAAGFAGCGAAADQKTDSTENTAASSAADVQETEASGELKTIDLVLDWYPNAIHTFLYDAIDKGYFAEEGLEVNLIEPADSVDGLNFVAAGRAQVGLTYMLEICQARENGMPVKALASACQRELDCFSSLASNEEITADMSCLKGKKVGYSGSPSSEAIMKSVAENAGLTMDDFEMVNVGFDLSTSLTTESVDLVTGMFINDEIVTLEQAGYQVNVYDQLDYGVPQMYGLVMAVNEEDYEADTEKYEGFLRACAKGFEDMKADEDAALEIIMKDMNSDENPLDEKQQRGSYQILMERMELPDAPFLSMSRELWQETIDWMVKYDLIGDTLTPDDVALKLAD